MSGVATAASKSMLPFMTSSSRSSAPTTSAPASRSLLGLLALRERGDAHRLAGAVRQAHRAADHLVGLAQVDAQAERELDRASNFASGISLRILIASRGRYSCSVSTFEAASR